MSNRTRKARKRKKKTIKKTLANLEYGLGRLLVTRQHHIKRTAKLDTKIAAAEAEIEIVKEEEAEA
jgi:hypothetical protein